MSEGLRTFGASKVCNVRNVSSGVLRETFRKSGATSGVWNKKLGHEGELATQA